MDDGPPRRLQALTSWQLSWAARRGDRLVSGELAAEGARKSMYAALAALDERDGVSQAELGRRVWMDRSDLHALLGELEAAGLVSRRPDERDRRRNVVTLTAAGAAMLERLERRVQAAQRALLAPLDEAGRDALVCLLARLHDASADA